MSFSVEGGFRRKRIFLLETGTNVEVVLLEAQIGSEARDTRIARVGSLQRKRELRQRLRPSEVRTRSHVDVSEQIS